jgi:alpha-L-rhamnosidase
VIGTQWLMRGLSQFGRPDLAFTLASNDTYPSWGYMTKQGATTIWELWNGNTANPQMNSQNHVMLLGDLLIWFYENLAGIKSDDKEIAFSKIVMKPSFITGLNEVNASYDAAYGKIRSHWKRDGQTITWNVTIPANTKALLYIPAAKPDDIKENGQPIASIDGVTFVKMEKDIAVFQVGSGTYSFTTTYSPF